MEDNDSFHIAVLIANLYSLLIYNIISVNLN